MNTPRRTYLCANQRSGSTLLCRALSATGIAGHPDEYFLAGPPAHFPRGWAFWEQGPLAQQHGVTDRAGYLELVYKLGSTASGVFGAKLMGRRSRSFGGTASAKRCRGCGRPRTASGWFPTTSPPTPNGTAGRRAERPLGRALPVDVFGLTRAATSWA